MYLQKVLELVEKEEMQLKIDYRPDHHHDETWQVRIYPKNADGYFFGYYDTLERACKKILQEMELL